VVEPEAREDEMPTGFFLVTLGEGRGQALTLLATRKVIKKTHPARCLLDIRKDPRRSRAFTGAACQTRSRPCGGPR
jgi:ParB family chromosome partitioning protein